MQDNLPRTFTVTEVAQILRVSRHTAYKHIRAKHLKCSKIGKTIRISEAQLLEFLG